MDDPRHPDDERPGPGWQEPARFGDAPDPAGAPNDPSGVPAAPGSGRGASAATVRPVPGSPRQELLAAFAHQGDRHGTGMWAMQHGWELSDGNGPRDGVLAEVVAGGPVRPGRRARAAGVVRGRAGALELVAFDVVEPFGRGWTARFAVTAAPMLTALPVLRLSPARIWKHRTGGLLHLPTGDPEFDERWTLLAAGDDPAVRRLGSDPAVRALLLGSDDRDELWTAAGHVAAVRPDGQRPELIEHHARLLTAVVAALTAHG